MIRSREVIPASLEHALIANRVLAALASNDLASEESREAVEDAVQFLNCVLEGGRFASSRSVAANSYRAALAYGEGVKAFELLGYQPGQDDDPKRYLQELKNYASAIAGRAGTDDKAVETLKSFFSAIRDIALTSTERPVERVSW